MYLKVAADKYEYYQCQNEEGDCCLGHGLLHIHFILTLLPLKLFFLLLTLFAATTFALLLFSRHFFLLSFEL